MSINNASVVGRNLMKGRTALLLLLGAHVPFLLVYYIGLWRQQTHYHFFPFALCAFIWLFISRRSDEPERWSFVTGFLIAIDVVCLIAGLVLRAPWLVAAGLCCSLIAWCSACIDAGYVRRLTYLSILPLLTLRLPLNGDVAVIQSLQALTTTVASKALLRLGFLHVRTGNVLDFPGKRFMVEEACSGVQSLFTILFIAALVICTKRRTLAHGMVLLASGVGFAGIMNVARVMSIAVAWDRYQLDLSTGIRHDLLGYACLTIAAVLLMSADCFLSFVTDPVPDVRRPGPAAVFRNPLIALWNWLFTVTPFLSGKSPYPAAASAAATVARSAWTPAAAMLCVVALGAQGYELRGEPMRPARQLESSLAILSETSLPAELSGFERASYGTEVRDTGSEFGEFSNLWDYSVQGGLARVACDHPFSGWHGLQVCYRSLGWRVTEIRTTAGSDDWKAVVFRMDHPDGGRHGAVVYSLFDSTGRPVQPQGIGSALEILQERLLGRGRNSLLEPQTYQIQAFAESTVRMDDQRLQQLIDLHLNSRQILKEQIIRSISR